MSAPVVVPPGNPAPVIPGMPPQVAGVKPGGNIYQQLEHMMSAVKKEAAALDTMKMKIKDLEEIKSKRMPEVQRRLDESEATNDDLRKKNHESELQIDQLRNDMQHLNDIYNDERRKHGDTQQTVLQQEQDNDHLKRELMMMSRELQKAGELRNQHQQLLVQMEQARLKIANELENNSVMKKTVDQHVLKTEKVKAEMTSHILSLTEEVRNLKKDLTTAQDEKGELQTDHRNAKTQMYHELDKAQMLNEDYRLSVNRKSAEQKTADMSLLELQNEYKKCKEDLVRRNAQFDSAQIKLTTVEEMRMKEKIEAKARINEGNEIIAKLRASIDTIDVELSDLRHQMNMITADRNKYIADAENYKKQLTSGKLELTQKDLEVQREIQNITLQRDDAARKAQDTMVQFDALHAQIRDMQERHWQELQKQKEGEASMQEEVENLTKDLDEARSRLLVVETEKTKVEEYVNTEVSNATKMVSTLQFELEKRLEELTTSRDEKEKLLQEKDTMEKKVAEVEKKMRVNEENFQRTVESDRQKLKQEVRVKMNRLNTLEGEKQELLGETSQLMNAISESKAEVTKYRNDAEDARSSLNELNQEFHGLRALQQKTLEELRVATSREADLKQHYSITEKQFKEDIDRLDDLVKQSKKTAAQQVAEISNHSKQLMEELEAVKKDNIVLVESEKRHASDLNGSKTELELSIKSYEEMQVKISKEVTGYKRDNQDLKSKLQLMNDTKTRMEMELMTLRIEFTKVENELQHCKGIVVKDMESKNQQSSEQLKRIHAELEASLSANRKYKMQTIELEEEIATKNGAMEKLNKECNRIKREETSESKKLKLMLNTNEQKLNECANAITILQRELGESQGTNHKLQTTSNQTISGLLEELRRTEDVLSEERKKFQHDNELTRARIAELQTQLERAKDSMEDSNVKTKQAKTDREIKMQQLEQEAERLRYTITTRDTRVAELEKLRQEDRLKSHELRDQIVNLERLLLDGRTNLELEQTQRHRLEGKIRNMEQEMLNNMSKGVKGGDDGESLDGSYFEQSQDSAVGLIHAPPPVALKQSFSKNSHAHGSSHGHGNGNGSHHHKHDNHGGDDVYDESMEEENYQEQVMQYNAGGRNFNSQKQQQSQSQQGYDSPPHNAHSHQSLSNPNTHPHANTHDEDYSDHYSVEKPLSAPAADLGFVPPGSGRDGGHGNKIPGLGFQGRGPMDPPTGSMSPVKDRITAKLASRLAGLASEEENSVTSARRRNSNVEADDGGDVEDTIAKTQQFLQRKMNNSKTLSAIDAANAALSAYSGDDGGNGGVIEGREGYAEDDHEYGSHQSHAKSMGALPTEDQGRDRDIQRVREKDMEFDDFKRFKQQKHAKMRVEHSDNIPSKSSSKANAGTSLQYFDGGANEPEKEKKTKKLKKRVQVEDEKETLLLPKINNPSDNSGVNSRGSSRGKNNSGSGKRK